MKSLPVVTIAMVSITLLISTITCQSHKSTDDSKQSLPKNEFLTILNDIYEKLGMKEVSQNLNNYLKKSVREGQRYTSTNFETDWNNLKENPASVISFVRKVTWPAIVHSSMKIMEIITAMQEFLLRFMKYKCDEYLGKDALFHPWNILNDKDTQNVSFIVFAYAVAISLILVRLLSWWNFMVFVALSFLLYSFGGPYLVFKWLLCITGAVWYLFDVTLKYPYQVAVAIIAIFLLSYVKGVFAFTASGEERPPPWKVEKRFQTIDREYNSLTNRLDSMEEKTNLLNRKLDTLSKSMERLAYSDNED